MGHSTNSGEFNMARKNTVPKSCGPQLLTAESPSHDWDVDRLGAYAQQQYQAIVEGERTLAPSYWRLGQALTLARKNFDYGQWGRYLATLGIDKTRSSKACTIYKNFASIAELENTSVEEAWKARPGRDQQPADDATDEPPVAAVRLGKALARLETAAMSALQNAGSLPHDEKQELLKSLRATIARLQQQVESLEEAFDPEEAAA
jgi:hypothetical protein